MFKLISSKLAKEITGFSAEMLEGYARSLRLKRTEFKIVFVVVEI